jgi:hypothetical protein
VWLVVSARLVVPVWLAVLTLPVAPAWLRVVPALLVVLVLSALPFLADPLEQPAPITTTMARKAGDSSFPIMGLSAGVFGDCVDATAYADSAGHCCILGSCVGTAYMADRVSSPAPLVIA